MKHPHDASGTLGSLPKRMVPKILDGRIKPSGFRCKTCGWDTDKPGYRGQQAMRGHMRVHVRTKRAWRRGIFVACLVLGITVIIIYRSGGLEGLLS